VLRLQGDRSRLDRTGRARRPGNLNDGPGSHTDREWLEIAGTTIERARLTTLILPGIGAAHDLRRAFDLGVRSVRVATHCTAAEVSAQHIALARELGMDVSGFLMMSHLCVPLALAQQAALMESYCASCIYVVDPGGRSHPVAQQRAKTHQLDAVAQQRPQPPDCRWAIHASGSRSARSSCARMCASTLSFFNLAEAIALHRIGCTRCGSNPYSSSNSTSQPQPYAASNATGVPGGCSPITPRTVSVLLGTFRLASRWPA
jgi:hypothetical protein